MLAFLGPTFSWILGGFWLNWAPNTRNPKGTLLPCRRGERGRRTRPLGLPQFCHHHSLEFQSVFRNFMYLDTIEGGLRRPRFGEKPAWGSPLGAQLVLLLEEDVGKKTPVAPAKRVGGPSLGIGIRPGPRPGWSMRSSIEKHPGVLRSIRSSWGIPRSDPGSGEEFALTPPPYTTQNSWVAALCHEVSASPPSLFVPLKGGGRLQ